MNQTTKIIQIKSKEKTLHKDGGSTGSNSASLNSLSKASSQAKAKTKPFPKVPSTNSILSFENDEGEVFVEFVFYLLCH